MSRSPGLTRQERARYVLVISRKCIRTSVVLAALAVSAAFSAGEAAATSHVYVTAWNDQLVNEFSASSNGALSSFGSVNAGDSQPWYIAMTSDARNLYLTTFSGHDLEAFDVGPAGALTQKDAAHGGQVTTGTKPVGIAVSPDDKNAYVANYNNNGAGSVSIYDIASDGSIKAHTPDQVAGKGSYGVAVSPDGKSVYIANSGDDTISQFDRAADGSLTAKVPDTVTVSHISSNPGPDYLALTPDGKHLYSANYNDSSIGVFDVGAGGKLTEKSSGSPVASGYGLYQIAVSPDGRSLYGPSNDDGKVYQYDIAAAGGLTAKSPSTQPAGLHLDGIWLSPDGKSAYAADAGTFVNPTSNKDFALSQFNVDSAGRLAAKSPATVATGDYPAAAMVAPDQGPTASFTDPSAGSSVKFDASGSTDPDGTVARYLWNFGDGTPLLDNGPKPTHTYAKPGVYTVTLTLFDDAGCSTALVYTGQTAYCHGRPAATTTRSVTVKAGAKKGCTNRRNYTFKPKHPPGTHIVDVKVFINGKLKVHLTGNDLGPVKINPLPTTGKFRVKVVATQDNGDVVTSTRTYHGCKKTKPRTHVHRHHH